MDQIIEELTIIEENINALQLLRFGDLESNSLIKNYFSHQLLDVLKELSFKPVYKNGIFKLIGTESEVKARSREL